MGINGTMKVATCVLRVGCVALMGVSSTREKSRKRTGASARPPAPKNTFVNLDNLSCNQTTNSRLLSLTKL